MRGASGERGDQRARLEPAQEGRVIGWIHRHRIRNEQQIETAALGDTGDLLHHRQFHVRGEGAIPAPTGHVIAGAKHENAEIHLTGRWHVSRPPDESGAMRAGCMLPRRATWEKPRAEVAGCPGVRRRRHSGQITSTGTPRAAASSRATTQAPSRVSTISRSRVWSSADTMSGTPAAAGRRTVSSTPVSLALSTNRRSWPSAAIARATARAGSLAPPVTTTATGPRARGTFGGR